MPDSGLAPPPPPPTLMPPASAASSLSLPTWIVHLRLQKTASSAVGRLLSPNGKVECTWLRWCKCHSMPVFPPPPDNYEHGRRCEDVLVHGLRRCRDEGRHSLASDPPHADFVDLAQGLFAIGVTSERVRMFTMLRDPIERALSEYLHVRFVLGRDRQCRETGRRGSIWAWDYVAPCNFTLKQFATDPTYAPARNRQTRMLAGSAGRTPAELYASESQMLAQAQHHLRRLSWFGLTDAINLSLSVLPTSLRQAATLGRRGRVKVRPATTRHREQVESEPGYHEALEALRAHNRGDSQLYAFARSLLDDVVAGRARFADTLAHQSTTVRSPPVATLLEAGRRPDVALGDTLPADFRAAHPGCEELERSPSMHAGSLSWYSQQHACAWGGAEALYPTAAYLHHPTSLLFSMRSRLPPNGLARGAYVVALGAAQTLGTMSSQPYSDVLQAITSLPVIPVGLGGTGPGLYSAALCDSTSSYGRLLLHLVRDAAFVVVQAMSGRSVGVSGCEHLCWNMYCRSASTGRIGMSERMARRMGANATGTIKARWIREHLELLESVQAVSRARTIFLYMSGEPWAQKQRSSFPQFVEESWLQPVCAAAWKCVTSIAYETAPPRSLAGTQCAAKCEGRRGTNACEQTLVHSSCACGFLMTAYYPSDAHQTRTARLLATALSNPLLENRRLEENGPSSTAAIDLGAPSSLPRFVRDVLNRAKAVWPTPQQLVAERRTPFKPRRSCAVDDELRHAILDEPLSVAPPLRPRFHVVVTKQLRKRSWLLMTLRSVVRLYPTADIRLYAKNDSGVLVPGGLFMQVLDALGGARSNVDVQVLDIADLLLRAAKRQSANELQVGGNLVAAVRRFIDQMGQYEKGHSDGRLWGDSGWYSHLSDFVRYAVLLLHGGVYLDLDAPLLKRVPGDARPHGTGASRIAFVGAEADAHTDFTNRTQLNGAVLGSTSGHPWIYDLFSRAIAKYVTASTFDWKDKEAPNTRGNFGLVGPQLLTNVTLSERWRGVVTILPASAFQPLAYWWGWRRPFVSRFVFGSKESDLAACFSAQSSCDRLRDGMRGAMAFHMNERLVARSKRHYPPVQSSLCEWIFRYFGVLEVAHGDEAAHQDFVCRRCVDALKRRDGEAFAASQCRVQRACFNDIVTEWQSAQRRANLNVTKLIGMANALATVPGMEKSMRTRQR